MDHILFTLAIGAWVGGLHLYVSFYYEMNEILTKFTTFLKVVNFVKIYKL